MKLLRNLTLLCSIAASPVLAQQTNWPAESDSDIGNENVLIIKERENQLPPANRSFQKVPPQQIESRQEQLRYNFSDYSLELKPIDPTVRVLTIKSDPPSTYYNNYIKAGVGNYFSSYLDAWLNSPRNPSYLYGLHLNHSGAMRGPVDGTNSSFSNNKVEAHGSYFGKSAVLSAELYGQRNRYNFYGYNENALEPERDELKQAFNMAGLKLGLKNTETDKLALGLELSGDHTSSIFDVQENQATADGRLRFELSDALGIQLQTDLLLSQYEDSTSINRSLFRIAPAFRFKFDPVQIIAGFNIAHENDTAANADQLHFYPRAEISISPLTNVEAKVGVEGNIMPVTYRGLINENPFLSQGVPLLHSNKTIDFYGSIEGRITGGLGFNVGFSAANYKNMYYFVNSNTDSTRFDVLYDSGNTALVNGYAELSYQHSSSFQTSLRGDYFSYSPDQLTVAWHKPEYKVEWLGSYNMYDKILFTADAYVLGGIKAREIGTDDQVVDLKPVVDLGLGVEYLFSTKASAYIKADNLLSKEFERYYNYPSRRLVLTIGGSYAF